MARVHDNARLSSAAASGALTKRADLSKSLSREQKDVIDATICHKPTMMDARVPVRPVAGASSLVFIFFLIK